MYDWNEGGTIEWYARFSGLNAVELNMSFYRFPKVSQVKRWRKVAGNLRWSVKVHRSITHYHRLGARALALWEKFFEIFKDLDDIVDFYLLQLPPTFTRTPSNERRLVEFVRAVSLGRRLAVEFRHSSWFSDEVVEMCRDLGVTVVSVDSPEVTWVKTSNSTVYLRLHGRTSWYCHDYSYEELEELARMVLSLNPSKVYAFFNNDHWMLENARKFLRMMLDLSSKR